MKYSCTKVFSNDEVHAFWHISRVNLWVDLIKNFIIKNLNPPVICIIYDEKNQLEKPLSRTMNRQGRVFLGLPIKWEFLAIKFSLALFSKHVLCTYTREDFHHKHHDLMEKRESPFQTFRAVSVVSTVSLSVDTLLTRLARLNSKYSLGHFIHYILAGIAEKKINKKVLHPILCEQFRKIVFKQNQREKLNGKIVPVDIE